MATVKRISTKAASSSSGGGTLNGIKSSQIDVKEMALKELRSLYKKVGNQIKKRTA